MRQRKIVKSAVGRRYHRLLEEKKPFPGLILIDGGVGQLHAAQDALEALGVINQPLASLAKKEELLFVPGQESEPIRLDRHSPVLHLVQMVRDEAHRFAVTFHRQRRGAARLSSELLQIHGVGAKTVRKLLEHFGSLEWVRQASEEEIPGVVGAKVAGSGSFQLAPWRACCGSAAPSCGKAAPFRNILPRKAAPCGRGAASPWSFYISAGVAGDVL